MNRRTIEGQPPINFQERLRAKRASESRPATALIQRMWGTLTAWQRDALWNRMSNEETIELVDSLPEIPENERTTMAAKSNRLFIRALPSPNDPIDA